MLPFVCGNNGYETLLSFTKIEELQKGRKIEAPLLFEGEEPTGKKLSIQFDLNLPNDVKNFLLFKLISPAGAVQDWETMEAVEITINGWAVNQLYWSGGISEAIPATGTRCTIKDENAVSFPLYKLLQCRPSL